jgi:MFS family permease
MNVHMQQDPPPAGPSLRRSFAIVVALLVCWTAMQVAWLQLDERIVEGDVMGNVGAAELFRVDRWRLSIPEVLARSYLDDYGEYPALYPALLGIGLAAVGATDLDGDAPALMGLAFAWLAVLATWALGLALGGGRVAWHGAALLLLSPLWTGMQRHVLLENGVIAGVTVVAAASLLALRAEQGGRLRAAWGLWLLAGLAAGGALLVKQTAVLFLVPIAAVGLAGGILAGGAADWARQLRGPLLAAASAVLLAAPWYLRHGAAHDSYLVRSLHANPDAVGPLHQIAYYPLVLLQLTYAPAALAALAGLAIWVHRRTGPPEPSDGPAEPADDSWSRWGRLGLPLLAALVSIALLMLLPKKYPRLVVTVLPLLSVAFAVHFVRWPRLQRGLAFAALTAALLASSFALGPLSSLLGVTRAGLVDVDERCFQSWVEPPSSPGLDWPALLAALEQAGGAGAAYRVGADRWPAPPCAHQTTHDLGQHLRVRVRRAGLEARVLAAEDAWEQAKEWREGLPQVLVSDGAEPCRVDPEACAALGELTLVQRVAGHPPGWPLDLHVFSVAAEP